MTPNLPESIPQCANHGPMTLVPDGGRSDISRWCGVWYECANDTPRCRSSVLIPSMALLAQLDEQRAKAAA